MSKSNWPLLTSTVHEIGISRWYYILTPILLGICCVSFTHLTSSDFLFTLDLIGIWLGRLWGCEQENYSLMRARLSILGTSKLYRCVVNNGSTVSKMYCRVNRSSSLSFSEVSVFVEYEKYSLPVFGVCYCRKGTDPQVVHYGSTDTGNADCSFGVCIW